MFKTHKRGNSESIKQFNPKLQNTNQCKIKPKKPKSTIYSLVAKSSNTIPHKKTIVENLDYSCQEEDEDCNAFFAFGRRGSQPKKWELDMDKITEVQDSNSRRQITSHRSHIEPVHCSNFDESKQNLFRYNHSNRNMKKSSLYSKNQSIKSKSLNTTVIHPKKSQTNKSLKKHSRNSTTHKNQKTKSTLELSKSREREKGKLKLSKNTKNKAEISDFNISKSEMNQIYHHKTDKLEKNMKMLWQCIGQLWESSRVVQYKSEKNSQSICDMKRMISDQEKKILEMKFEIQRAQTYKGCLRY